MTHNVSCEMHFVLQNREKRVCFYQVNVTYGGNKPAAQAAGADPSR